MDLWNSWCTVIFCMLAIYTNQVSAETKGALIFGRAGELVRLDLLSKRLEKVTARGFSQCTTPHIAKLDDRYLLLGEECGRGRILKLDLNDGTASFVTNGYEPTYLSTAKKLFYFRLSQDTGGLPLFVSDLDKVSATEKVVNKESFSGGVHIIPISASEILFFSRISRGRVWRYDVTTMDLNEVRLGCTPAAWRSATKQLLCFDAGRKRFILTDLRREHAEVVSDLDRANPLLYIDQLDALVFDTSEYNFFPPERRDLVIYDFKTHKLEVLLKGVGLNWGAVVYLEQ